MIIVVASIAAILTVPLTGRSLSPLARLDLRRVWMVWLSISLQLLITLVPRVPNWLGQPLHLFTFALSAGFLWSNRHLPGAFLVAVGAASNLAAIAANNGTMPASAWAWKTAGFPVLVDQFENSNIVHDARLPWLGDVFAIPARLPLTIARTSPPMPSPPSPATMSGAATESLTSGPRSARPAAASTAARSASTDP